MISDQQKTRSNLPVHFTPGMLCYKVISRAKRQTEAALETEIEAENETEKLQLREPAWKSAHAEPAHRPGMESRRENWPFHCFRVLRRDVSYSSKMCGHHRRGQGPLLRNPIQP